MVGSLHLDLHVIGTQAHQAQSVALERKVSGSRRIVGRGSQNLRSKTLELLQRDHALGGKQRTSRGLYKPNMLRTNGA